MPVTRYDSIVIGGGSAGLAFAKAAAQHGASVAMIEKDKLGGTCVNRGCVPKKMLWSAGHLAQANSNAAKQGITSRSKIDFAALVEKRDAHISDLNQNFETSLSDAGVKLWRGAATLVDAQTVQVEDNTLKASQVVLATGCRPSVLDIEGSHLLSDSSDVFSWTSVPNRLVIVGGGYIGCEFAAIFNALGADVTLVHNAARVLDTFPEKLAKHLQSGLIASGVKVVTEDALSAVSKDEEELTGRLDSGSSVKTDAVIAAIGRTPNIEQLGPISERFKTADNGTLLINGCFATNISGLYAIGDVADRLPLTPVATADGQALADMLHGGGATPINLDLVATTAFVYPPAAFVGTVGTQPTFSDTLLPLSNNILAPETDHKSNFFQLGFDENTGIMTGAELIAEAAPDLIALAAALIAAKAPASVFSTATAIHPSFAEEFFGKEKPD